MLTVSATPHDAGLVQVCAITSSHAIAAPGATRAHDWHASWWKPARKSSWVTEVRHVLQAEPTGGSTLAMTGSKGEVSITVGIRTGRGNA
jgi:hypothetical protein